MQRLHKKALCQGDSFWSLCLKSHGLNLLAHWTFPQPFFTIKFEIRLKIPALDVTTIMTSSRQTDSLEGERTAETNLKMWLVNLYFKVRMMIIPSDWFVPPCHHLTQRCCLEEDSWSFSWSWWCSVPGAGVSSSADPAPQIWQLVCEPAAAQTSGTETKNN